MDKYHGIYSFVKPVMMRMFYILFIKLYPLAARLISPFNQKAKRWVNGRKDILARIRSGLANDTREKLWVHCASLGEYEQGLPLMNELKKQYPSKAIVLTFFSPSGYEYVNGKTIADHVFYMPMDSVNNARNFFDIVQPATIFFIKYEFWYYYFSEAKKRNIPLLLVSAIFRKSQPFFKWYGSFHRSLLACVTHCFVQTHAAAALLNSIRYNTYTISGDTRFDRVKNIAADATGIPAIEAFCAEQQVIVAGSTWTEDDEALDHFANTHEEKRFVIAPHDISQERLKECLHLYQHSILYSDYISNNFPEKNVNTIVIDNVGMLKYLYRYATICYVGGGFGGDGVHNVLEAAVYGKPVVFGPEYEKYEEAKQLVAAEGGFPVDDALELEDLLNEFYSDEEFYNYASKAAHDYVYASGNATATIMEYIYRNRLLTN